MNKVWSGKEVDNERIKKIIAEENLNIVLAGLASNRFLDNYHNALNISYSNMHSPYELPDMDLAVDRILEAIDREEKVLVYGDYDADGITSTTILYTFLKDQGIDVSYYIPNRLEDGYGLNNEIIKNFKDLGYTLIITVDTGIVAIEEAKYAKEIGMDLIITDHHEMQEEIPDAIAVVDPKRIDSKYPFKDICGAFVAYKLMEAVCIAIGMPDDYIHSFMPIAAIGTIADVMPLEDENRILVSLGIANMKNCKNYGIKEMIGNDEITAEGLAFTVVPKLNAAGRLGSDLAAQLLTSDNEYDAKRLNLELEKLNEERKNLVVKQTNEIIRKIEEEKLYEMPIVIVAKEGLHEGIVGILAAKVAETYNKSAVVLTNSQEDTNMFKGSGRGKHINMFEELSKFKKLYSKFGGHEKALGLSIEKENLDKLVEEVKKLEIVAKDDVVSYDMIMNMKNLSIPLVKTFDILEPFGKENPKPTFLFKDVLVKKIYEREKVTSIMIVQDGITNFAITFDTNKLKENDIIEGDNTYIIAMVGINRYNGKENLKIEIVDIQKVDK